MSRNSGRQRRHKKDYSSSSSHNYSNNRNYDHNLNSNSINKSFSDISVASSKRDHKSSMRHKIKQSLLEKLEELEADLNGQRKTHDNIRYITPSPPRKSITPSHSPKNRRKHTSSVDMSLKNPKEMIHHKFWKNELRSEWERSRSEAAQIKLRNESSQIWWLQEDNYRYYEDDDLNENPEYYPYEHNTYRNFPPIKMSLKPEDELFNANCMKPRKLYSNIQSRNNSRCASRMNSVGSNKPQIQHQLSSPLSHSSFSRSSRSGQIAQATGYQSTTDEISSFNHDTDGRSTDNTNGCANSATSLQIKTLSNTYVDNTITQSFHTIPVRNSLDSNNNINNNNNNSNNNNELSPSHTQSIDIPQLNLCNDNTTSLEHTPVKQNSPINHLIFREPYQKEDFIRETIISPTASSSLESINDAPFSPDTFRIDD